MRTRKILEAAESILIQIFPAVIHMIRDKFLPAVEHVLSDDRKLTRVLHLVYRLLPFPVRFAVSKERFTEFVLARKNSLFQAA